MVAVAHHRLLLSYRGMLALVGFLGSFVVYAIRSGISVAIVCMVNQTAVTEAMTESHAPDRAGLAANRTPSVLGTAMPSAVASVSTDGEFDWDRRTQGLVLGAYFWGYLLPQVPAGFLCQRWGARRVVGVPMLVGALATLASPAAARFHVWALLALRMLAGAGAGVFFPGFMHIWSRWAPPLERTRLAGVTYAGIHFGIVLTMPIASVLCQHGVDGGWPSVFYFVGGLGVVWCLLWLAVGYDDPNDHPWISSKEKDYIHESIVGESCEARDSHKIFFPTKAVLTSLPVWALIAGNVAFDFGCYSLLTSIPKYFNEVLHFSITENGILSAAPFLAMAFVVFSVSLLADHVISRHILAVGTTRKLLTGISFVVPAALILVVAYISADRRYAAVTCMVAGVAVTGLAFGGTLVNNLDIAPRCAGILMGASNSFGAVTGFMGPAIAGMLTHSYGSVHGWRVFFVITAVVYVSSAVFYSVFASGAVQQWALPAAAEGDGDDEGDLRDDKEATAIVLTPTSAEGEKKMADGDDGTKVAAKGGNASQHLIV